MGFYRSGLGSAPRCHVCPWDCHMCPWAAHEMTLLCCPRPTAKLLGRQEWWPRAVPDGRGFREKMAASWAAEVSVAPGLWAGPHTPGWVCRHCPLGTCPLSGSALGSHEEHPLSVPLKNGQETNSHTSGSLFCHTGSLSTGGNAGGMHPLVWKPLKVSAISCHPCASPRQYKTPFG